MTIIYYKVHMLTRYRIGACFADCIEAVAKGEGDLSKLPRVAACDKCSKFKTNCQECTCIGDGGAECAESFVCGPVTPVCMR